MSYLRQMCEMLVPEYSIETIKYFTAPVSGKEELDKPIRQQTYLRALRTIGCEIIPGKFMTREAYMRLAPDPTQTVTISKIEGETANSHRVDDQHPTVLVLKTEEKGSDVNLASHLLINGFEKRYEAAIVLTNDSDLTMPIRYVRENLGFEIVVINPDRNVTSKSLAKAASTVRQLRAGVLEACQFTDVVYYPKGMIKKPDGW